MVEKKTIGKIANFEKAINTLQVVLLEVAKAKNTDAYEFYRDSLIQRFEYSIDMFWKMLREFIVEQHGIDVPASPKAVLKQAFDISIIDETQYQVLISSVNDRNLSSHAYHEKIAEQISSHVQGYYLLMQQVTEKLKLDL